MADLQNPFSFLGSRFNTSNINPQTGSAYTTAPTLNQVSERDPAIWGVPGVPGASTGLQPNWTYPQDSGTSPSPLPPTLQPGQNISTSSQNTQLLQMLLPLLSGYLGQQGQVPNVADYSQRGGQTREDYINSAIANTAGASNTPAFRDYFGKMWDTPNPGYSTMGGQTPGAVASPPAVSTNTQANPFSFLGSRWNTSNIDPQTGSAYTTAPSPVLNGGSISPMLTGSPLTQTQMLTQTFQKLLAGILGGQRPTTSSGSVSPAPTTVTNPNSSVPWTPDAAFLKGIQENSMYTSPPATQPPPAYTPPSTLTTQNNPFSFLGSRWDTSNIDPITGSRII